MAYYLTVIGKKKNRYIDISNHILFKRISEFTGEKYSLEEIDIFTSKYANMLSLKEALLFEGLIEENEAFEEISIRMKNNGKLIKVKYEPVFIESIKYMNINYLTFKIKSLAYDYNFLNKLINCYGNSHVKSDIAADIREFTFGNLELDIYKLLDQFISREIYSFKFDIKQNKYVTVSVKYKSLHDLAMFVYNYENKSTLTKKEINDELNLFISYLKEIAQKKEITTNEKAKARKKIRKLDKGQTSFFD